MVFNFIQLYEKDTAGSGTAVYDKNGNFLTLTRRGLQDGGTYGLVDNLTFTYSGNQATRVDDSVSDPTYNGAFNFKDGASQSNEYAYDKNGNMTKDLNKNISSIQYNSLNLPSKVNYSDGKYMEYVYSATGEKRSVTYNVLVAGGNYTYCGNFVYYNNVLNRILTDDGYVTLSGSTPTYNYYLKDHLGNNRVVVNASGTVRQVNHYYPFGGLFGESTNGDFQAYKYNGKEFNRLIGLDWYDYGARHMTPDAARFTTMDPLAEKYYNVSPYAYCLNNPIKHIDINGFAPGDFFTTKDAAAKDFGLFYNAYSIKEKREYGSTIYEVKGGKGEIGYTYSVANRGDLDGVQVSASPFGSKDVATIHSHGSFSNGKYNDNEFSGIRDGNGNFLTKEGRGKQLGSNDIGNANNRQLDSYLVTPNGSLQKYDPQNNQIIIISNDMPSDPNDPSALNQNSGYVEQYNSTEDFLKMIRSETYSNY